MAREDLLVTPQAKPAEAGRASGSIEAAAPVGSSRRTSTSVASVMTLISATGSYSADHRCQRVRFVVVLGLGGSPVYFVGP
jgi:hypothetical protein